MLIVSACPLGDGSSQGHDRSSWEREEEREMSDCDQQHLSQLDYTDLFCFFNLERIFWQFCYKLAVLGSAFLQRPHTVLYSSAWQPDFGFIVQSTFNQEVTFDLWPKATPGGDGTLLTRINEFLSVRIRYTAMVTLMMQIIFWNLSRGAASYCTWLTFSRSTATSKDCTQQMDLPNVLIVLLHRLVHLHEQT